MELQKSQLRFMKNKHMGFQVIKGNIKTGKTTAALNKAVLLENEYCLFDNDKIIYVCGDEKSCINAGGLYKNISKENKYKYMTLFSDSTDRVHMTSINEIIEMYAKAYIKDKRMCLKTASEEEKMERLEIALSVAIEKYKKSKLIKKLPIEFVLDEVNWIKSCALDEDEYLNINRKGRGKRIKKNSDSRRALYNISCNYTDLLSYDGLMDEYDYVLYAIKSLSKYREGAVHIIVDDCERMKKGEIKFLRKLYDNKPYSNFICIVNNDRMDYSNAYLKKGINIKTLFDEEDKIRTFNFKGEVTSINKNKNTIAKYEFVDLKHNKVIDFKRDTASYDDEIMVYDKNDEDADSIIYEQNEQISVPVFSDIAAGEPILINSQMESTFKFPNVCLKDEKNMFLLHVKGDSMKNANIIDGDFILIKRQNYADHNDIVAADIDGSATLKRLKFYNEPCLMPENEKYSPIKIKDRNVNILGVAVGILKRNDN